MRHTRYPYFTPDVIDILTAYIVDYVIPLIAFAQATGRTKLVDYDLGVTVREAPAYDGRVTITIRIGATRYTRELWYDIKAADPFFDELSKFAAEAACRAAGVHDDPGFILDLTKPDAGARIAAHRRNVNPVNAGMLAEVMIRSHTVR